jgi:uncharacterized repeat protein (TIGR03803 family)
VFVLATTVAVAPLLQAQTYTMLHAFTYPPSPENPYAGLTFGPGGLYGASRSGKWKTDNGTVYKVSLSGQVTILYDF